MADNFKQDLCIFTTNYYGDITNLFKNEKSSLIIKKYTKENI